MHVEVKTVWSSEELGRTENFQVSGGLDKSMNTTRSVEISGKYRHDLRAVAESNRQNVHIGTKAVEQIWGDEQHGLRGSAVRLLHFVATFVQMEQAEQPEQELAADGECLMDEKEVERKGDVCNGLGEEDQLGLQI